MHDGIDHDSVGVWVGALQDGQRGNELVLERLPQLRWVQARERPGPGGGNGEREVRRFG
jgi:hypothetical protein